MPQTLPPQTLAAFDNDELRARIFYDKYALRSLDDEVLEHTPKQMWQRLAREMAVFEDTPRQPHWRGGFMWLLDNWRFVPAGRILFAVGNSHHRVTAQNCYTLESPHDSIPGIFTTALEMAETFKRGGGCGIDISTLRPAGAAVRNAARTSTGAVSFMELYSTVTGLIGQQGRRGALMITISDSHPDVLAFCRIKRDQTAVRYANISVRLTDDFLRAVAADSDWLLYFSNPEVGLEVKRVIKARELWDELVQGARDWAEPGCLYWSTVQRGSLSDLYTGMEVTTCNPCQEESLEPYGVCCLGSLNLSRFIVAPFTEAARVAWGILETATRYAVRFLDNVLTWNAGRHPLPQQEVAAQRGRRIGPGVMGVADMLAMLGLRYDTDAAIECAEQVMNRIKTWAYDESANLAREKGAFPAFNADKHLSHPFFASERFDPHVAQKIAQYGLRNVTLLTVAPTGSIATMAGTTGGVEPIFALSYTRRSESLSQSRFEVEHPALKQYQELKGNSHEPLPNYFVTAHEISSDKRIAMQAAIQRQVDQAISSTVNLPAGTSVEAISHIYRRAWEEGTKGISIYCSGSREDILTPTTCVTGSCEI